MYRSRLNKTLEKETRRNFFLVTFGLILIFILFTFFGTRLLVQFSLLVEKKGETTSADDQNAVFVPPPQLDSLPDATNSAEITVKGSAVNGDKVQLFVNGKKFKETDITANNSFTFTNVRLEKGANTIKARTVLQDGKLSRYSDSISIHYLSDPPELSIYFPSDGQSFTKENNPIRVSGKTSQSAKVTVNDFWAIVDDDGNYHYTLLLKGGENYIKVKAVDKAGNTTEKEIKVTYSE
ncbi:MAG: hypothetical protein KatS3mg089_0680 [Patescibacteria group bacterium]|nr:MAG: hypothetical protein KatS3mg089_0680 [Patescibacteria group bacterium]